MKVTVKQLNTYINGTVQGDEDTVIEGFSPIEEADEGSITFLANPQYQAHLEQTRASAILVNRELSLDKVPEHAALIYVNDVYSTLSFLMEKFQQRDTDKEGIEAYAYQHETATIGAHTYLGAFSYVGRNVEIGDYVKLYPHAVVLDNTRIEAYTTVYSGARICEGIQIGKHCIVHSGAVIGSDGFGFAYQNNGSYRKMPQTGNVVIKDHVEIGANTTIDRATMRSTTIERGVKLDNLIQVAHNVEIGENTAIAAQVGISGSTKIGRNCVIAGQVGIVGHITIADGSHIGAQSGISTSIKEANQQWFGAPAVQAKEGKKRYVLYRMLPDIYSRLKALEQFADQLKSKS